MSWLRAPSRQTFNLCFTLLTSEDAAMCRFGYNTWRDPLKPTAILEKVCKERCLDAPIYEPGCVTVDEQRFTEREDIETEQGFVLWFIKKYIFSHLYCCQISKFFLVTYTQSSHNHSTACFYHTMISATWSTFSQHSVLIRYVSTVSKFEEENNTSRSFCCALEQTCPFLASTLSHFFFDLAMMLSMYFLIRTSHYRDFPTLSFRDQ